MLGHIAFMNLGEGGNDEQVAHAGPARGRTVDGNHARAALALDGVGHKALAVVDIPDMDLFVLSNVGGIQQILVDGTGAFVVQARIAWS